MASVAPVAPLVLELTTAALVCQTWICQEDKCPEKICKEKVYQEEARPEEATKAGTHNVSLENTETAENAENALEGDCVVPRAGTYEVVYGAVPKAYLGTVESKVRLGIHCKKIIPETGDCYNFEEETPQQPGSGSGPKKRFSACRTKTICLNL